MKRFILLATIIGGVGCTDANMKQFTSLGYAGTIVCYSGGKEIYTGTSTGKIATEKDSDGWYFVEAGTSKLIRVSGDCLIKN